MRKIILLILFTLTVYLCWLISPTIDYAENVSVLTPEQVIKYYNSAQNNNHHEKMNAVLSDEMKMRTHTYSKFAKHNIVSVNSLRSGFQLGVSHSPTETAAMRRRNKDASRMRHSTHRLRSFSTMINHSVIRLEAGVFWLAEDKINFYKQQTASSCRETIVGRNIPLWGTADKTDKTHAKEKEW